MKSIFFKKIAIASASLLLTTTLLLGTPPKITLVIVVDQLSYHTFERLTPYFKYGFKKLIDDGVNFTNAFHPHGNPVTATGHATIGTGALAKDHGVVLNAWMEEDGTFTTFGDDDAETSAVFSPNGFYTYGLSAHHMLIETLADKLVLTNTPQQRYAAYAIASKSRAALAMAGKLGKAIWFDGQAKRYTSSKAYFKKLPAWLQNFNKNSNLARVTSISWTLAYPPNSPAYKLPFIHDYRFAGSADHPAHKTINLIKGTSPTDENGEEEKDFLYEQTPWANKTLVDLCKACIDAHDLKPAANHLVLLVSVSNYDKLGHLYGQQSLETTDLLYHLDRQLAELITYAQKKVGKKQTLIALTADHGCCPIPEIIKAQGFYAAGRLDAHKLKKAMNELIEREFGVKKIVAAFKNAHYFLDKRKLPAAKRTAIIQRLKTFLEHQPGIKACWTKHDLETTTFPPHHLEQYYKNQFHPQRSGDLIVMPYPYVYFSKYPTGTGHATPYAYDTQVPLILYQCASIEKKRINQTVFITQLVPTLADALNIQPPAGALAKPLL